MAILVVEGFICFNTSLGSVAIWQVIVLYSSSKRPYLSRGGKELLDDHYFNLLKKIINRQPLLCVISILINQIIHFSGYFSLMYRLFLYKQICRSKSTSTVRKCMHLVVIRHLFHAYFLISHKYKKWAFFLYDRKSF